MQFSSITTSNALITPTIQFPGSRNFTIFEHMDFQAEKEELIKLIGATEDPVLVLRTLEFVHAYQSDFWHTLPAYVKDGVKTSLRQAEEGELISWEEVQKRIKDL